MSNLCHKCFYEYDTPGSCPRCGYDATAELGKYPLALRPGSILGGRYIVGRVLGEGGFGITYSAQDYDSKDLVAIKEHFPSSIVTRTDHIYVSLISDSMKDAFVEGKEKFLSEAQTLSQFNGLENICDIYSYFEENGTAYFAMEYVNGIPLDEFIKKLGRVLSFEEAARLLLPVMDALSHVHEKGIIHRDISPDNIMVSPEGKVMLIDFGAARYSMGEKSRSLDVILKHGFAPREQYARHGRQGAYTDVYAVAATFYYSITGKVPPDAIDRTESDELKSPSSLGIKLPRRAEQALMKALSINYGQRWQSMREFAEALKKELPPSKAELERQKQQRLEEERKKKAELEEKKRLEAEEREKKRLELEEKKRQEAEARRTKQLEKEELKRRKTEEKQSSKARKSKKPLALIAALAAIAIGAGAFFTMDGENKAERPVMSEAPVVETSVSTEKADNITWELSEDGKTLTISGEGPMKDWNGYGDPDNIPPWLSEWKVRLSIEHVIIEDGITHIGAFSFNGCPSVYSVTIPLSVTSIGENVFQSVKTVNYGHYHGTEEQWKDIDIKEGNELLLYAQINGKPYSYGNIFWELSGDTLIISGEGRMHSYGGYGSPNPAPWCVDGVREHVKKAVISPGITHVGGLMWLENMEEVELPDTVVDLDYDAFFRTPALRTIKYNGTVEQWTSVVLFSEIPANVQIKFKEALASGRAGENISWALSNDGTFYLSGSGDMDNYRFAWGQNNSPWSELKLSIRKLDVAKGITSIGSGTFTGCIYLSEVALPDSVTVIGNGTFAQCSALRSISLPDSLASMGIAAFHTSGLRSIRIPDAVTKIQSEVFNNCQSLSEVILPDSLNYIGNWAFQYCPITSIEIPESVKHIDDCAFQYSYLRSIKLPASLEQIGDSAFRYCASLNTVEYAGSQEQWDKILISDGNEPLENAQLQCNFIAEGSAGENAQWTLTNDGTLTISGTGALKNGITQGGSFLLAENKHIEKIVIENGIGSIGIKSFSSLTNLKEITLPSSLTNINSFAFSGCLSLETVNFQGARKLWDKVVIDEGNDNLKNAELRCSFIAEGTAGENISWVLSNDGTLTLSGNGAMEDYKDVYSASGYKPPWYDIRELITSVVIEDGITTVGAWAFYDCKNIKSVDLPDTILDIGAFAFSGCVLLENIELPDKLTVINDNLFSGCRSLKSINIPVGVISLGRSCFQNNSQLESIVIPEGVYTIMEDAFINCSSLRSITLPASLTSIASNAFISWYGPATLVYYYGTQAQWESLTKDHGSDSLRSCTVIIMS